MRRPIHLQARRRLAVLVAIPVLVSLLMWWVSRESTRDSEWVKHTLLIELSLERCLADLQTAASEQRGYLVSQDERFLVPYREAAREARDELARLEKLSVENPSERQAIAGIRPLMEARLAQLDLTLSLSQHGLDSNIFKSGIERGRRLMSSLQSLAREIYGEEQRLLETQERALALSLRRFLGSLILGYGLILVAVSTLYRDVRRYGRQTADAEERLLSLNSELDERVRSRTALLRDREELLSTFVKHVPAAVAMLDRQMHYLQVSDRWSSDYALGSAELLGHSHYEIFPGIAEHWKEIYARCLAGETLRSDEDRWQDADGNINWLRWEIRPWGNLDGLPEGILIFSEDISERKRSNEMLKESEATTRALLETAAQAILVVDANGNIVLANRMTGEMFGYDPGELLGRPREMLMPDRPRVEGTDHLGRRMDSTEFPIEVSLSSVPTTRGALSVSFISDTTMRRQAETALRNSEQQLRELAGNLLTAQEDERRRVARELHDDVTQTLAFLSIELGRLAGDLPDTIAAKRDRVRALQEQTLRASQEVRRLSHGLHPSVIEDFGLSVALEEFCEEFEKAQGVRVRFDGLGEDARLNHAGAACLYRVAQESLRNAVQHGQANEISVELKARAESVRLRVRDNGKGFSDPLAPAKGGLGMISMRERMRLVNGTLTISSVPEQGTEVAASAPLT